MKFEELNLAPQLLQALAACGYEEPTPIQAQTIPALLAGSDLIGSAQTGTGKTAAFVLPALHRLATPAQHAKAARRGVGVPRVLVLAPTRELAQQVADQVVRYGQFLRVRTVCIYGGAPYPVQNRQLERGVDVLVATPGRLIDHIDRGRIDLSGIEMLIIDEADRMLDMGFIDDVDRIAALTPKTRQTVLFSATFDGAIAASVGAPAARPRARRRQGGKGRAARDRAARAFRRRPRAQASPARSPARRHGDRARASSSSPPSATRRHSPRGCRGRATPRPHCTAT